MMTNAKCLFLLLLVALFCNIAPSRGQTDSEILLKFKASLLNTRALAGWTERTAACDGDRANWIGVLCDQGLVWGLQLETMGLKGKVDTDSLAKLEQLKTLSLMNNEFQGPLPELKKLTGLRSLYLSNNQFGGEIPGDAFDGMVKLKKLYLSGNRFVGAVPYSLAGLSKLTALRLEQNGFTGRLPRFEAKFESFNVSNNMVEGPIPDSLSNMDSSAFSGNKGLCGKPLSGCKGNYAPTPAPAPIAISASKSTIADSWPTDELPTMGPIRKPSTASIVFVSIVVGAAVCGILVAALILMRRRKQTTQESIETPPQNEENINSDATAAAEGGGGGGGGKKVAVAAAGGAEVKLSFVREDRGKFELQDLLKASAEILGSGCFGASYKAALTAGEVMVVKRFKQMNNVGREEFHEHMRRLGRLRHANLLPLVAYYYRKEEKLLVHDFVPYGSLAQHLHRHQALGQPSLEWESRLKIIKGVAKGMAYLYKELPSLMVPHGHLKSTNVLLDESFEPYLTDYALIPVINQEKVQELMVAYKSPEYLNHGRVTKKTDVWSLGMLVLEVMSGKLPPGGGGGDEKEKEKENEKEEDLARWVRSIPEERWSSEVIDKELWGEMNNHNQGEMVKLVRLGLTFCQEIVELRPDLKAAVERIDEVKANDGDNFDDDFYSLQSEGVGVGVGVGVVGGDRRKPSRELSADFSDIVS